MDERVFAELKELAKQQRDDMLALVDRQHANERRFTGELDKRDRRIEALERAQSQRKGANAVILFIAGLVGAGVVQIVVAFLQ